MFKYVLCVGLLVVLANAASLRARDNGVDEEKVPEPVSIIKSVNERRPDGSFMFSYEGSDGSFRKEVGIVKNAGTDDAEIEITGTYRYYDGEGNLVEVNYTAGKDGFVPVGTNISPEISAAAKAGAEAAQIERVAARNSIV